MVNPLPFGDNFVMRTRTTHLYRLLEAPKEWKSAAPATGYRVGPHVDLQVSAKIMGTSLAFARAVEAPLCASVSALE